MIGMVVLSFIRKYFLLKLYMAAILGNVILVTKSLIIKYLISQFRVFQVLGVPQKTMHYIQKFINVDAVFLLGHLVKCSLCCKDQLCTSPLYDENLLKTTFEFVFGSQQFKLLNSCSLTCVPALSGQI